MSRTVAWLSALLFVVGCQLPPEQVPLKPLPEDGSPVAFADLALRTRSQVDAAREAFYVNNWTVVEESGNVLEQTARLFTKTTEIPANHKDSINVEAGDLAKEAAKLREAGKNQDVKNTNESLQRLQLIVRQLTLTK